MSVAGRGRGSARAVATLALLLATAGCETSRLARDVPVEIAGRVVRQDGAPVANTRVVLTGELTPGEAIGGLVILSLSVLLACLVDPPPAICTNRTRLAAAGPGGDFRYSLTGADAQSTFGFARSFTLSAQLGPSRSGDEVAGPASSESFKVQTGMLNLPDLRLWEPPGLALALTAGGRDGSQVRWDSIADRYGGGTGYQVGFLNETGGLVWSIATNDNQARFDARVLEDARGSYGVTARRTSRAEGTAVTFTYRSSLLRFAGRAGAPPSRGRGCQLTAGDGAPMRLTPCPLTDGEFARPLSESPAVAGSAVPTSTSTPGSSLRTATIDLGSPRDVALVVVRGAGSSTLEGSVDGRVWSTIGTALGDTAVSPPQPVRARYIRLSGSVAELREVSVWDGPSAGTASTPDANRRGAPGPPAAVGPPLPPVPPRSPQPAPARAGFVVAAVVALVGALTGLALLRTGRLVR